MTISIHRIVECKGENVLENTSKTLTLGWSYSKYLSGYQNIFTHWLFFPLPISHARKTVEVKSKLPFCCQSVLGWLLQLAAHQNHQGPLVPTQGQLPLSLWGGAGSWSSHFINPLNVLEGTLLYPEWSHGFLAEDTASQETKAVA